MKQTFRIFLRILAALLTALLLLVLLAFGGILALTHGPSEAARNLFVLSVKETSAAGFLADWFLPAEVVNSILHQSPSDSSHDPKDGTTDPSLIEIPTKESTEKPLDPSSDSQETQKPENPNEQDDGIEVLAISGPTYKGTMLIVKNPSRIVLGTPDAYGENCSGLSLRRMIAARGALAGINAGGFYDPNGQGTGGIPTGIVIQNGVIAYGNENNRYPLIGFDSRGILHVGTMSGRDALAIGIQYAVSFTPGLIVNGRPCNELAELGGGYNPRSAIGQRSDGAVLLLVVEGRNLGSLGCTYDDLVEIMLAHGAINAANLDGGSSSLMMYRGETLTKSAYVYGERILASAFLVLPSA